MQLYDISHTLVTGCPGELNTSENNQQMFNQKRIGKNFMYMFMICICLSIYQTNCGYFSWPAEDRLLKMITSLQN